MLGKEIIDGVLKVVQTLRYSNGKVVKRVLNATTGIPEQIIDVK